MGVRVYVIYGLCVVLGIFGWGLRIREGCVVLNFVVVLKLFADSQRSELRKPRFAKGTLNCSFELST